MLRLQVFDPPRLASYLRFVMKNGNAIFFSVFQSGDIDGSVEPFFCVNALSLSLFKLGTRTSNVGYWFVGGYCSYIELVFETEQIIDLFQHFLH